MSPQSDNRARVLRRPASSLSSLEPIDTSPFKRPSNWLFVWFTVILIWLISLLPWRLWQPAPDLLLLVLAFWCLHEPQRVTMLTAFVFGLLMDVHDGMLLGGHALVYSLAAYGAVMLHRRLQHFNAVIQAMHMLPVFLVSETLGQLVYAWVAGEWGGWQWLWSVLFTAVLWPLADILLLLPQRRLDEKDAGSV
ncbi:rod shape-determining protein MreD [Allopusillimonas soli]|uniref:Rod shape-determining protein MreD n=1 Tax=Allopusillimonas soli TaxID=659016 RepID=A0A853FCD6_9BURK|nr:rod shape-determining protein MreD [Allopusillimonas soli]NYT36211.1 rod shape-determining protein MreD [Allopusillimonas soli]TEA76540.1 rod shape-determining protein MreD [Allopusillimonas soli]